MGSGDGNGNGEGDGGRGGGREGWDGVDRVDGGWWAGWKVLGWGKGSMNDGVGEGRSHRWWLVGGEGMGYIDIWS